MPWLKSTQFVDQKWKVLSSCYVKSTKDSVLLLKLDLLTTCSQRSESFTDLLIQGLFLITL